MSRANQQNSSLLRTATHLGLLGALAASLTSACVSSNNGNNATGGQAGGSQAGGSAAGGSAAGGAIATGGTTAAGLPACNLTANLVDGCQAVPNPKIFAISDTCSIGLWAGDSASGGEFWQPWCTSTTGAASCDSIAATCSGGSIHVSGSYAGSGSGNSGFGTSQEVWNDAGVGCPKMDIRGFTGVTIDINTVTVPNNYIYLGFNLGDGNTADHDITPVPGPKTYQFPFGSFTNKNKCGSLTEPGLARFTIAFSWFNDGAAHPVDVTFSNIGFY